MSGHPSASESKVASGFNPGLACAGGLIPHKKRELSLVLHAGWTREALEQIRREVICDANGRVTLDPDSQTCWWLAAESVRFAEGYGVNEASFLRQIQEFQALVANPLARAQAATCEWRRLRISFVVNNGVPQGRHWGCITAALLAGHNFGTMSLEGEKSFYIGTSHSSLGLEDFRWSSKNGRLAGPVFGSRQLVRIPSDGDKEEEFEAALTRVIARFKR